MSEILFIADLHLDPKRPTPMALCLKFLADYARQSEALYILGDLFEVWVGDDDDNPTYQKILAALHDLTTSGIPVYVMCGNRDFLLGEDFAKVTGCQVIPDSYLIDLYGVSTLLMHGDSLCTLDVEYQAFRQQVRNRKWQEQFLAQPLTQRHILAQQARTQSQAKTTTTLEAIMDVTSDAVISVLETHGVYHLIHGHTHRPFVHHLKVNGKNAIRRVVGDWRDDKAIILKCTPKNCQLINLYEKIS
ncbi:UDP-2,3-diacylglucosamine diphosphatase [Candidatus Parabeggiatoa sp. HSG14]|uniref:UDP-2,3-diacylglucosamine diphosphatase n=1 Tax=Candidatus Parabeggiatoa sp. HSG14 TaxID=3055593 RepID=UPI0025A813F3|nr:UDP-2,3-diacylglucosamine diphosphatase [Thiotrichales bacterium HSG14]